MEPDDPSVDPKATAALVMQLIDDIDVSDDEQRDALLADLLCAAWPTKQAQDE